MKFSVSSKQRPAGFREFGATPSRKLRAEARLGEDACDVIAFVALNLDLAVFHRATDAAGLLHLIGELFLLGQSNADEALHHRHHLAVAMGGRAENVHAAATTLPSRGQATSRYQLSRCLAS